jgi:hypothetical protein
MILLLNIKIVNGKSFKKVDHIDWKIIMFAVQKRVFFTPCKAWLANIESSSIKTFVQHKLKAFDIVLGN